MIGALSKVRVLDLTQMMAGPYCTMMLADQGADVIKIEAPSGEVARGYGPFLDDDADRHYGGYFQSINRNKRSIVIDLKSDQGKDVFRRLVRDA
ncbi:MAG: CoA transferase, partial [Alphaproteobacteria bacterium]